MTEDKVTYTLNCDNCGNAFYSSEAFPEPLLCPKCLKEGLLLTDEELINLANLRSTSLGDLGHLGLVAQAQLSKAQSYYEAKIEEAKKQERETIGNYFRQKMEEVIGGTFTQIYVDEIETLENGESLKSPEKGGS